MEVQLSVDVEIDKKRTMIDTIDQSISEVVVGIQKSVDQLLRDGRKDLVLDIFLNAQKRGNSLHESINNFFQKRFAEAEKKVYFPQINTHLWYEYDILFFLLEERFHIAEQIGILKQSVQKPVLDEDRWGEVKSNIHLRMKSRDFSKEDMNMVFDFYDSIVHNFSQKVQQEND